MAENKKTGTAQTTAKTAAPEKQAPSKNETQTTASTEATSTNETTTAQATDAGTIEPTVIDDGSREALAAQITPDTTTEDLEGSENEAGVKVGDEVDYVLPRGTSKGETRTATVVSVNDDGTANLRVQAEPKDGTMYNMEGKVIRNVPLYEGQEDDRGTYSTK